MLYSLRSFFIWAALILLPQASGASELPPLNLMLFGAAEENEKTLAQEMNSTLEQYRRTGEAHAASPVHRVTPLHVATFLHDMGLIRELLEKGASPDARMEVVHWYRGDDAACPHLADTPLTLVLRHPTRESEAQEIFRVCALLIENGANLHVPGYRNMGVLRCCIEGYELAQVSPSGEARAVSVSDDVAHWQALASMLIHEGAPADEDDALSLIAHGWSRAFCHLMRCSQGKALRSKPGLILSHLAWQLENQEKGQTLLSREQIFTMLRAFGLTPDMVKEWQPDSDAYTPGRELLLRAAENLISERVEKALR